MRERVRRPTSVKSNRSLQEILSLAGEAFPLATASSGDAVGLQTSSRRKTVRGILVAHDVTSEVIDEAVAQGCNLIVSYHPLVYGTLSSLEEDRGARVNDTIAQLVRKNIALYVLHTAVDQAPNGTSEQFALALGLERTTKLEPLINVLSKISVFVPEAHADRVMTAMADAGAGTIGKYDSCSFRSSGTGTFRPLAGAKPFLGKKNVLERAAEDKLEMIVPAWKIEHVIRAMREAHPYEEIAHDVVALSNSHREFGMGTIGEFSKALGVKDFIAKVKRTADQIIVRASEVEKTKKIRRVAIVAGSGGAWMEKARRAGADAFITGDVKFHSFSDASHNNFLLVDAGHRETERFVVPAVVKKFSTMLPSMKIVASKSNQAIQYF